MKQRLIVLLLSLSFLGASAPLHAQQVVKLGETFDAAAAEGGLSTQGGVVYNATNDEWVVSWLGNYGFNSNIRMRTISAEAKLFGPEMVISTVGSTPDFGWDSGSNQYMVVYRRNQDGHGRLISSALVPGPEMFFSNAWLEMRVVYNTIEDELVFYGRNFATFPNSSIVMQRIDPASGALIGGEAFVADGAPAYDAVYNPTLNEYLFSYKRNATERLAVRRIDANGSGVPLTQIPFESGSSKFASGLEYDATNDRYLVVATPFSGGDPVAQFLSGTAQRDGPLFPLPISTDSDSIDVVYVPRHDCFVVVVGSRDNGEVIAVVVQADGSVGRPNVLSSVPGAALREVRLAHRPLDDTCLVTWRRDTESIRGQLIGLVPARRFWKRVTPQPFSR